MKKIKVIAFLFIIFLASQNLLAQPAGYYDSSIGLSSTQLQQALHNIIDGHTVLSYTPGIWNAVKTTDDRMDGKVWDMYSDNPSGTNPYDYTFVSDQCGNYGGEGDCYNREHSFPKSWFNDASPMNTDLNHIFPTDGYVNNRRGNYAFGETSSASWTSQNGSKVGSSSVSGFSGTVFEPIDEYKGDFARAHLYMAVRYYGEDSSWDITDMTERSQPKDWALTMLLQWHVDDPVSQKEIDRNNEVYVLQGNRNPFIDDPDFANRIWGSGTDIGKMDLDKNLVKIFPNPIQSELKFSCDFQNGEESVVSIISMSGSILLTENISLHHINRVNVSFLKKGSYLLVIQNGSKIYRERFIKL